MNLYCYTFVNYLITFDSFLATFTLSGAVELEKLPLKKDALKKLKLPVDIKSGTVQLKLVVRLQAVASGMKPVFILLCLQKS